MTRNSELELTDGHQGICKVSADSSRKSLVYWHFSRKVVYSFHEIFQMNVKPMNDQEFKDSGHPKAKLIILL